MGFKVVQVISAPGAQMPDYGEMIRQAGVEVEFVRIHCTTGDEIIVAAHDADAIIGVATFQSFFQRGNTEVNYGRLILSMGIGYDYLDVEAATEHGILAANVPDYCDEDCLIASRNGKSKVNSWRSNKRLVHDALVNHSLAAI